jgi:ATP-dependent Clp protease ATP-binding subunit ClpA
MVTRYSNLSIEKNEFIYNEIADTINQGGKPNISSYRISVFLLGEWLEAEKFHFLTPVFKQKYFIDLAAVAEENGMLDYLIEKRINPSSNTPFLFNTINDFIAEDSEERLESFELLSELEVIRLEVLKDFLANFKPILRKGIVQSLKYSSEISLTETELSTVYNLLGYFSTETGKNFLANVEDDPDLIKRARKLGDFTGLKTKITQKEIRELLSHMTGIPIQSISSVESQKLVNLESTLHKRVIGQEEAVSAIAKAIRRSRLGIQNPNRPIASFLFCGPTGVGKTEVTKALAVSMFGSENDMIRFDMSEFMEKFTLSRLLGSPPGYVGYDEGGQLTDAVRRKPYSVVLFDEVEKAHPDILNILLQILEDGRLTDSQKRLVPFENTVIIMTSNAAAEEIQQIIKSERASEKEKIIDTSVSTPENTGEKKVYEDDYAGAIKFLESPITESFLTDIKKELRVEFEKSFRNLKDYDFLQKEIQKGASAETVQDKKDKKTANTLKSAVLERLSQMFLPEFLNRLDDIIIFQPLKPEELRKICDIMIRDVGQRIEPKQIFLHVEDKVKAKLTREGYNPLFGARPLRRLVTKYIEDLISEYILKNPQGKKGYELKIQLNEEDQIIIKSQNIEK